MNDFSTPAGWYPDGDGWERRWDGSGWTEDRRRMAEPTQVRPAQPGPPPAPSPQGGAQHPPFPPVGPPSGPPAGPPQQGPTRAPAGPPPFAPPPPPGYGNVPGGPGSAHGFGGGFPPPPGRGPGGPGSGGKQKKSRLGMWLGLAVALLLIVGIAVTVAVLKPWQGDGDDEPGPKKDPGPKGEKAAIQGDVNGDSKGDALFYLYQDYDNVKKVTAASNGNGFDLSQVAADPYTEPRELYLDWDGDGVNEKLVWRFVSSGKQITLSSNDSDFPGEQNFTLSLSSLKKYGDLEVRVVSGDFDGDDDLDLAIAGPNDRVVDISVLLNDGKGTFAEPVLWLSVPNAVISAVQITPGDFDADGDADLWAELPADRLKNEDFTGYYSGDRGYALLTSTGSAFSLGAVNKSTDYSDAFLVGDVKGDGTVNIVGVEANSYREQITVTVYDVSSGSLKPITGFTGTSKIGQRALQGASLSDVDGDGKADVVFVVKAYKEAKFTGVQVMRSTGAVFDPALVWADLDPCQDENCRVEFVGSRRY